MMRKYFKHGHTSVRNQIILDTGCYTAFEYAEKAWIDVLSLERAGARWARIAIPLYTTVQPTGTLRLLLRNGMIEVHYSIDAKQGDPFGDATIGLDIVYTDVFMYSDGG